ncbi:hypothetical protein FACS1894205_2080 [Alphaproteobacteria bacterium]|nr:hypothetical protein FACS1894205_2080 [Alphaproteobacteria bacterium]
MGVRGKVEMLLPKAVKTWLDAALMENNFSGYSALADELASRGYKISRSSLHRYGSKAEKRVARVFAATETMKAMDIRADALDSKSAGLLTNLQVAIFETLSALDDSEEEIDPAKRIKLLAEVGKNVAAMARSSIELKRHQGDIASRDEKTPTGAKGVLDVRFVDPEPREKQAMPETAKIKATAPKTDEGLQ